MSPAVIEGLGNDQSRPILFSIIVKLVRRVAEVLRVQY
jgi:hypothetical protein